MAERAQTGARPRGPLIAVVGPTAVGKSALALRLAAALGGEIVTADSRQVYRGLDIGTAKPTLEERARVPHHLLDVADPDERYDLARFQREAFAAIDAVLARGRVPLLVGGTGLYVRAVVEGYQLPAAAPDLELRRGLEARAAREGGATLHAELARLAPALAARIDPRNVRRVIRAIERARAGTDTWSLEPRYRVLRLGLTAPRPALYARIDRRVDEQIAAGLVEEVRRLLAAGHAPSAPAMTGIGYRQIVAYLEGRRTLAEAIADLEHATHRYARQQYTWFRLDDPRIHWFDVEAADPFPDALRLCRAFLTGHAICTGQEADVTPPTGAGGAAARE